MNLFRAFYKSAFPPDDQGHGGQRRSWQVRQLYLRLGDLVSIDEERTIFYPAPLRYWTGLRFLLSSGLPLRSLRHISLTGHKVLNLVRLIRQHPDIRRFVWEPSSDYEDFHIPLVCKRHDVRVVALPHNLESLVPGRESALSGRLAPDWFLEEVELLRECDSVVTISTEEQWLLGVHCVDAFYLPYMPSQAVVEELLGIRKSRSKRPTNGPLLMLGTASNPPTVQGMRRVLDNFLDASPPVPLIVAGYGTEALAEEFSGLQKTVSFRGSVEPAELQEMLCTCRAVLIFQEASSGALTRLQEMCLAGIPVIGNQASLRSYRNISGLHAVSDLEELSEICLGELEAPQFSEAAHVEARKIAATIVRRTFGTVEVSKHVAPRGHSQGNMQ